MRSPKRRTPAQARAMKGQVDQWASKIGVTPVRVQIQHMTKKWASCSPGKRISLSRDLLGEDTAFQQVVIVHELLHLRVPNHGKLFKSLMKAFVPGWEKSANGRIRPACSYKDHSRSKNAAAVGRPRKQLGRTKNAE